MNNENRVCIYLEVVLIYQPHSEEQVIRDKPSINSINNTLCPFNQHAAQSIRWIGILVCAKGSSLHQTLACIMCPQKVLVSATWLVADVCWESGVTAGRPICCFPSPAVVLVWGCMRPRLLPNWLERHITQRDKGSTTALPLLTDPPRVPCLKLATGNAILLFCGQPIEPPDFQS